MWGDGGITWRGETRMYSSKENDSCYSGFFFFFSSSFFFFFFFFCLGPVS
jgi:hypothetical protein